MIASDCRCGSILLRGLRARTSRRQIGYSYPSLIDVLWWHHHHNVHSSRVGMPLPPQVMAKKQSAKSPWMCVTVLCFSSIPMIPRHHPNIKAYTILSHTNIIIILKNNLLIFGYIFYVQVQYYRSSTVLSVITFCVFFSLLLPRCWSIVLLHSRLDPVFVSLFLRVFPSVVVLCGVH